MVIVKIVVAAGMVEIVSYKNLVSRLFGVVVSTVMYQA